MAKIRKAKIVPVTYAVDCPYCGEPMACPDGSLAWDRNMMHGQERECYSCQKVSIVPAI